MSLRQQINDDVKAAMRAREQDKLATLRMLTAAIKQREVDERIELGDKDVLSIVEKSIKQRREAAEQYRKGDRPDLAEQEQAEADILAAYLPPQLDEAAIVAIIQQAVAQTGAESPKDMGKVMGVVKPQVQGQADMGQVSQLVKASRRN